MTVFFLGVQFGMCNKLIDETIMGDTTSRRG